NKSREPFSPGTVAEIELQAGLLERAEEDVRDVLLKAGRVAARIEVLLNEENMKRITGLLDSFERTSDRYGKLARDLGPTVKALPPLLQQTTQTVARAQITAESLAKLAEDTDRRVAVLDATAAAATRVARAVEDLDKDTLPRVNALLDEV